MSSDLAGLLERLPGRELAFAAGAPVFHIGDAVRFVHFVRKGTIHLIRHQDDGSSLILQRATSGAILAEASVYSERYHCDARAETDAITWAIVRRNLLHALSESPDLEKAWTHHLAHEIQRARLHAEILSIKTVAARLTAWCAWHGGLPAKGQWANIANEIGVSPEALYREIARRRRV
ncbi:Crp/Fnr family transcriptional regulator [Roseiarcaceae bacterium H3SJ34-1]|uniref:Crp/Fnr family transcriptional regulator n=1 Tax=Terripilifer ovatus TaxID=3032367 RepID=UPI003AB96443|nr:Crp/Fnr family transcriptional regulator [Roseiarcaceae bacterium H3SJ34-1]